MRARILALVGTIAISGFGLDGDPKRNEPRMVREGTHLKRAVGKLDSTSGRSTFTIGDREFTLLENLALERMEKNQVAGEDNWYWEIDAVVTQYNRANYLLVTRALHAKRPPKATTRFFFKKRQRNRRD